jgi:hypothetical protein
MNDVYGDPGTIVKIEVPREINDQGRVSVLYSTLSLFIASLILGGTMLFLIERIVLSRLSRLSSRIKNVSESKNDLPYLLELPVMMK